MTITNNDTALVAQVREAAIRMLTDQALVTARAAGHSLTGLVINDDEKAVEVSDLLKILRLGSARIKTIKAEVCGAPRQAIAEAGTVLDPIADELLAAEKAGRLAQVAWDTERQKRARAEQARLEAEAREAAEQAAADAAMTGDDDLPPPVEVAPVRPPNVIRGGIGATHFTMNLKVELVDHREADASWLVLKDMAAKQAFQLATPPSRIAAMKEEPSVAVVWRGVRFWYEKGVAVR